QQRKENLPMKPTPASDLILFNGRISTLDPKHPEATNVAVENGRIVGVDDAEEHKRGPNTKCSAATARRWMCAKPRAPACRCNSTNTVPSVINTAALMPRINSWPGSKPLAIVTPDS